MYTPHIERKMVAMAMSLSYRQYMHLVGRPLKPPSIPNCLAAIVYTKLVIAILVPKFVAMATTFRHSISAMSSSDSLTPKNHN